MNSFKITLLASLCGFLLSPLLAQENTDKALSSAPQKVVTDITVTDLTPVFENLDEVVAIARKTGGDVNPTVKMRFFAVLVGMNNTKEEPVVSLNAMLGEMVDNGKRLKKAAAGLLFTDYVLSAKLKEDAIRLLDAIKTVSGDIDEFAELSLNETTDQKVIKAKGNELRKALFGVSSLTVSVRSQLSISQQDSVYDYYLLATAELMKTSTGVNNELLSVVRLKIQENPDTKSNELVQALVKEITAELSNVETTVGEMDRLTPFISRGIKAEVRRLVSITERVVVNLDELAEEALLDKSDINIVLIETGRLRKKMQKLKNLAQGIRAEVTEMKNND